MAGTPPYVYPPFGNIDATWVLFADGHFGPVTGGGGGPSNEILVIVDTSASDQTFTLPDPASLSDLKTVLNVKNWNGGLNEMHIAPGVGLTIDGGTDGIRTRTNNQGYRLRWGPSADENPVDGWVCIETVFGGDTGPAATEPPWIVPVLGLQTCSVDAIMSAIVAENVQTFAADGTWTKPTDQTYRFVTVVGWGGGGGGGGGCSLYGGGGGGGASRIVWIYDFATLPATVAVTIGLGGTGGVGATWALPFSMTPGGDGGNSTFGSLTFYGGAGGGTATGFFPSASDGGGGGGVTEAGSGIIGGDNPSNSEGANGVGYQGGNGFTQRTTNTPSGCAECGGGAGGGSGSQLTDLSGWTRRGGSSLSGAGGGGGGGPMIFDTGNRDFGMAGGDGGWNTAINGGGAAGGVGGYYPNPEMGGQPGSAGYPGTSNRGGSGGGGGAGHRKENGASVGGIGGAGGIPGGGAGGGGGCGLGASGDRGGNGGDGARGEVRVYSWR